MELKAVVEAVLQTSGLEKDFKKIKKLLGKDPIKLATKIETASTINEIKKLNSILRNEFKQTGLTISENLEILAGKQMSNSISWLLTNISRVEAALESSQNSARSAIKEHEKWLESLAEKSAQFETLIKSGTELVGVQDTVLNKTGTHSTIPAMVSNILGETCLG